MADRRRAIYRARVIEAKAFLHAAELAKFWLKRNRSLLVPCLLAEAACRMPGYKPGGHRG